MTKESDSTQDQELDELVRDLTAVGSLPKSEARRRILSYGNKREAEGARKTAIVINGELGLELTENGNYYIARFDYHNNLKEQ